MVSDVTGYSSLFTVIVLISGYFYRIDNIYRITYKIVDLLLHYARNTVFFVMGTTHA